MALRGWVKRPPERAYAPGQRLDSQPSCGTRTWAKLPRYWLIWRRNTLIGFRCGRAQAGERFGEPSRWWA